MKNKQKFLIGLQFLIILGVFIAGCVPQAPTVPVIINTPEPLTGIVTRGDVQASAGWESLNGDEYVPDVNMIKVISEKSADLQILLFLGTWCGDSKREVPRFFKLMDQAGISENQMEIIALDRSKKDLAGLTEKWSIEYVPTFVLIKNGKEIGRIVELPKESLETDLVAILSREL